MTVPSRIPLSARHRALLHLAFVAGLAATLAFTVRMLYEPHLALGFDVARDGVVAHVVRGSAAEQSGLRIGDRLRHEERAAYQAWLDAPHAALVLHPLNGDAGRTIRLPPPPHMGLAGRLAAVPFYRWVLLGTGLIAFLIGWAVVRLNPDAPGTTPFALWSMSTLLVFAAPTQSAAWSASMDALSLGWRVGAEALFQGFGLHWLLLFPRRLVGRRPIVLLHAGVWLVTAATVAAALADDSAFVGANSQAGFLLETKSGMAALILLALTLVQLARASSRRQARQAAWVLLAAFAYGVVDLALWTLPDALGYDVPLSTPAIDALVAASYLVIPAGIAVAVTREQLFGIDRAVLRGLAYVLALALLAALYLAAAAGVALLLDRQAGAPLPVRWGVLLALAAAMLLQPLLSYTQRAVDRLFDRRGRQHRAALDAFEHDAEAALRPADLTRALVAAVRLGTGVACRLEPHTQDAITARPGVLALDAEAAFVTLDGGIEAGHPLRLPLRTPHHAFGTLCVGNRPNGEAFTDDDLAFLRTLARRYAGAAERMRLREEIAAHELEAARTRLRIAADLHDDVGAGLSSIALLADLAGEPGEAGRAHLDTIRRSAREMVDAMRDIVWSIDPASDGAGALAARMRDTADGLLGTIPHTLHLPSPAALDALGMDARRHLLLLFKEALHNVVRHANASSVTVRLAVEDEGLVLTVRDDGVGFDPATIRAGTGLRSMRERAEQLGGTLAIESTPGQGTTVRAVIERREHVKHNDAVEA